MIKYTIITPVYNGEKYIATCIESVNAVNYNHNFIEHIIVDDGSTDNTKSICLLYANKYKHIKFYSKENGNWGSVINYVKNNKLATGDYILMCDADDAIMPNAFYHVNKKVNRLKFIPDLFSGSFYLWNGHKKKTLIWSYYYLFAKLFEKKTPMNFFSPLILPFSIYIKSAIFYQTEDLKENIPYQDSVLLTNAFFKSKTIGITKKAFSKYWKTRPNNTMSYIHNESGILKQIENLNYYSKNNLIEPFIYQLFGLKSLRKYLEKHNLSYYFKNKKPDFTGFPWWARWALRLMYKVQVKKFIK